MPPPSGAAVTTGHGRDRAASGTDSGGMSRTMAVAKSQPDPDPVCPICSRPVGPGQSASFDQGDILHLDCDVTKRPGARVTPLRKDVEPADADAAGAGGC